MSLFPPLQLGGAVLKDLGHCVVPEHLDGIWRENKRPVRESLMRANQPLKNPSALMLNLVFCK